MASGTWSSKEFANFSNECMNTYSKFKSKNKDEIISKCKEFGSEFKKALNAELGFKLNYRSNDALRIKYEGVTMGSVVNNLGVADSDKALSDFDAAVAKFNADTTEYFNKIRSNFENAHNDLSNVQNLIKGHFQSFYKTCIVCAGNLENEKNITANLKEIVTASSIYLANSKKVKTKKKFFKTIGVATGRAALIASIQIAARHLSNFKF